MYIKDFPFSSIITVDSFSKNDISGMTIGMYTSVEEKFDSFSKLLKNIYPSIDNIFEASNNIDSYYISDKTCNNRGKICTFIVEIIDFHNHELKGSIIWIEKKKELLFRSELELMKIINEVMEMITIDFKYC